jgi:hypothetical protein
MSERQRDVLRLQPHMIPGLRASFRSAVDDINNAIFGLSRGGFIPEPWLGDEVSGDVAAHYRQRAMEAPDSSFQALVAYRDELAQVHDTLARMEDEYRRREGDDAARWGRMA